MPPPDNVRIFGTFRREPWFSDYRASPYTFFVLTGTRVDGYERPDGRARRFDEPIVMEFDGDLTIDPESP